MGNLDHASRVSSRNLQRLPSIEQLKRLLQSLAILDAILCPEWEYRMYSFNASWGEGEQMGSMRNGSGDEFFAWFSAAGCYLKGFAHESPMTPFRIEPPELWPGLFDNLPQAFNVALEEPAFSTQSTTYCLWRSIDADQWSKGSVEFPTGKDPDGSADQLAILDLEPASYAAYADTYFEVNTSIELISHVYQHRALSEKLVQTLNPNNSLERLFADLNEIGYPQR